MNKRILYLTLKLFNFKISRITYLFIALILGLMINVNANEIKVKQLKINTNLLMLVKLEYCDLIKKEKILFIIKNFFFYFNL